MAVFKDISEISIAISKANDIVITCHVSPDGDAIGSSLCLWHILKKMDKNVFIVTPDQHPKSLSFLSGANEIIAYSCNPTLSKKYISNADLIFCLDFNTLSRLDALQDEIGHASAIKVLIDHHLYPDNFAQIIISDPKASSTCLLLYHILKNLNIDNLLDCDSAECLYTGMMTDTGNFSYNSNDPQIYIAISDLLSKGIDKDKLYSIVCNTNQESRLRICGYALYEKMKLYPQHRAALISLSLEEMKQFNYKKGDTEGLVNIPLSIPGVFYSAFIREDSDNIGRINVSMRSKGEFPVNKLCENHFNGGGHKNAAGGEIYCSLECAINLFESLLTDNDKLFE